MVESMDRPLSSDVSLTLITTLMLSFLGILCPYQSPLASHHLYDLKGSLGSYLAMGLIDDPM